MGTLNFVTPAVVLGNKLAQPRPASSEPRLRSCLPEAVGKETPAGFGRGVASRPDARATEPGLVSGRDRPTDRPLNREERTGILLSHWKRSQEEVIMYTELLRHVGASRSCYTPRALPALRGGRGLVGLALLIAVCVAAGLAGSASALRVSHVVPPAGTPDLSQMVLQPSDFSRAGGFQ